ncbi:uncharacterized protein LOC119188784 [Manduca sexta]|uniref:uncharacterized protein LOC119188784 n=1 Tax=Manduca sexta TaxID=7130 RepID=UPI00188FD36A|nr:uncharacterized protein LOC119188784 [Manduca sexta]
MAEQDVQTQLFVPDMIRFSGEDPAYTSSKWAQDLDDNAEIFGWTPQQRLVIARRSLTGTAELWLKTERVHKTYDELKTAILKEFPDATNIKEMHELMAARKKRKEESFYQYMLIMKEMGKRAKFPDYIAIQYIIDGIVDLEVNKSILYGAATYPAFKEKLTIYEMIKKKSAKHVERPAVKQAEITSRYHCYNCGGKNHVASACGNGLKCFKCNQFGHISTKCTATEANIGASGNVTSAKQQHVASGSTYQQRPSLKQRGDVSQSKPSKHVGMVEALTNQNDGVIGHDLYEENVSGAVMQVVNNKQSRQILSNNALKAVKLGDFIVDALVDTGSDVNLMSEDLCEELKVQCVDDETLLSGLGLAKVKSCGKVFVNISVDGHCYSNIIFHVISKESMPYRLIIGQEFLKNIVMVVREGAVLLLTQDDEWLARVNCCMSVCEVTGHISNVNIKTEVTRLIEEYRPNQIKEAPIQMKIVLKDDIPVAQRPRRLSIGEQKIVEELVEEWLHKGIIREIYKRLCKNSQTSDEFNEKGVPFIFEDEQRYAFNILKQMLTSEPVLKIYNPNLPTELHTDASSCALAAILLQLHPEGELHPVHYMSRKTTEAESRYSSYELEALAIVEALLTGTKMRCKEDIQVMELLQQEIIESYDESRESLRQEAKQQIQKMQDENKKAYDKKRKPSSSYELDDLVAIKRTQFGPGQKVKPKFLGPYRVVKVKRNDRYDVEKLYDTTEGPNKTSSSADLMKKWPGIV